MPNLLNLTHTTTKTASAIAESDTAKKGAAEANARALEAQLALEKFKAPRGLTDEQVRQIADKLKQFAGQEFQITPYWAMKEPLAFANQIYTVLYRAEWKYIQPEKTGFMLGGIEGVQVWRHPNADDRVQKAADALVAALNNADVATVLNVQNVANPIGNKINLNVGTKPRFSRIAVTRLFDGSSILQLLDLTKPWYRCHNKCAAGPLQGMTQSCPVLNGY